MTDALTRLRAAGVPDPERDLRRLERWAPDAHALAAAIDKRAARMPVSKIIGERAFWTGTFKVTDEVLDPRPDTETLVEQALTAPFNRVLDLGTGSGCIPISLLSERAEATAVATDISPAALDVAAKNARYHSVQDRLTFVESDWFSRVDSRFDLITSNPPYIAAAEMPDLAPEVRDHDPEIALTDGADGLTAYRHIAAGALAHLTPGGRLLVEIGPTQAASVTALFADAGLENITPHPDLDGRDRVVSGRAPQA
ncbi:MAG: peptide chain release factor N(5)-glutamine methyltransferase [Pseudomonadota bacterium]